MNGVKHAMSVAARFSAASSTYHQAAVVQQKVAERLVHLFPPFESVDHILEVGCGTGMLTTLIRKRYPEAWIDAVDISSRMIAQSKARLASKDRIQWLVADVRHLPATTGYPLVVSSSSLHWVIPLEEGLAKLSVLLEANGYLIFALMVHGTLGELRESRLRVAPHKPPLADLPTSRGVRQGLAEAGLTVLEEQEEILKIAYPSAADFLRHIHEQGLTGGCLSVSRPPLNRSELQTLNRDYNTHYGNGQGVVATYHVAYFTARKASMICSSATKTRRHKVFIDNK